MEKRAIDIEIKEVMDYKNKDGGWEGGLEGRRQMREDGDCRRPTLMKKVMCRNYLIPIISHTIARN
jgi:hypothetical protein